MGICTFAYDYQNLSMNHSIESLRKDFPILQTTVYGKPLVYLDSGATTQKPKSVIESISNYYENTNSNVHRGVHYLSQIATEAMEAARADIANFINAASSEEIIFTKGTTDSINLIANAFAQKYFQSGDELIFTEMEHHSNIVPWQLVAERYGVKVKYIPLKDDGTLDVDVLPQLITNKTKIIACTWVSNVLGTVNPLKEIIKIAHNANVPVFVDAAQAIQHMPIDVQALDIDFLAASGHKMYGPTGIGILYGKRALLETLPPYQGGGSMIKTVSMVRSTYADLPFRFEAGTPDVAGAIGLGEAVSYLNNAGIEAIARYEQSVFDYTITALKEMSGVNILGNAPHRAGAISLTFDKAHPFDVGEIMDKQGVAVRTGHHCCNPIMSRYDIVGTLRMSFGLYTNKEDVDAAIIAMNRALKML